MSRMLRPSGSLKKNAGAGGPPRLVGMPPLGFFTRTWKYRVICVVPFAVAGNHERWMTVLGVAEYGIQLASRKSENRLTRYSLGQPVTPLTSLIVKVEAVGLGKSESTGLNDLSVTPPPFAQGTCARAAALTASATTPTETARNHDPRFIRVPPPHA